MSNEVTVLIKNGKIVVDFSLGNLKVDSINLAAQIKQLPDIKTVVVKAGGNISIELASVTNVASLQYRIAQIANSAPIDAPATESSSAQLSLF